MQLIAIGMAKSMMDFELLYIQWSHRTLPDQYKDFSTVKDTLQGSLKSTRESEEITKILDEWKCSMDRRRGFVCFHKSIYDKHACECKRNEIRAVNIMKLPVSKRWAFPPITPDPQHLNHYMTFDKLRKALKFSSPDEHLKEVMDSHCEKC